MPRARTLIGVLMALALIAGCATAPPRIDPEGAPSFDGLVPLSDTAMDRVWVRPDLDLSGYDAIVFRGAGISYRAVDPRRGRALNLRQRGNDFPLTERQKEEVSVVVREAFETELARVTRYRIVTEPGPGVLVLYGALIDVVSHVPPEPPGRSDVYMVSIGEASLVLELRDAQTEEVLVRSVDRRAAQRGANQVMWVNPASSRAEVRRLAMRWATLLRERIDGLPELLAKSTEAGA